MLFIAFVIFSCVHHESADLKKEYKIDSTFYESGSLKFTSFNVDSTDVVLNGYYENGDIWIETSWEQTDYRGNGFITQYDKKGEIYNFVEYVKGQVVSSTEFSGGSKLNKRIYKDGYLQNIKVFSESGEIDSTYSTLIIFPAQKELVDTVFLKKDQTYQLIKGNQLYDSIRFRLDKELEGIELDTIQSSLLGKEIGEFEFYIWVEDEGLIKDSSGKKIIDQFRSKHKIIAKIND